MAIDPQAYVAALPLEEQRAIYDNLAFTFDHGGNVPTRTNTQFSKQEADFYNALESALRSIGSIATPPMHVLAETKGIGRKTFTNHSQALHDYVNTGCRPGLPYVRKCAIMRELFICHARYMAANIYHANPSVVRATHLLMPRSFGRLPTAVENSFPGYVASRLLHLCVQDQAAHGRLV